MNLNNKCGTQKYEVGKMVTVDYAEDLNKVCDKGIYYFKTEDQAKMYELKTKNYTGEYCVWYDNGQIYIKCNYVNGKMHGMNQIWYKTGQLSVQSNYINDKREGKYQSWYMNGQKWIETNYINDIEN